jgi:hypothetical protein
MEDHGAGYRGYVLSTYLNDHLLGSTAGLELVRRARKSNAGTDLGDLLARLETEIDEDREVLRRVIAAIDAHEDKAKVAAGWTAEKLGRLKPNGQLRGYSPLSRVVELEGLLLGVNGKAALWRMLGSLADPRLASFDFDALAARAERQIAELEPQRIMAGGEAFAATPVAEKR